MKSMTTTNMISGIIGGVILLIAGVALWPVLATQLDGFAALNLTGGALLSSSIVGLLFVAGIGYAIYSSMGLKIGK